MEVGEVDRLMFADCCMRSNQFILNCLRGDMPLIVLLTRLASSVEILSFGAVGGQKADGLETPKIPFSLLWRDRENAFPKGNCLRTLHWIFIMRKVSENRDLRSSLFLGSDNELKKLNKLVYFDNRRSPITAPFRFFQLLFFEELFWARLLLFFCRK